MFYYDTVNHSPRYVDLRKAHDDKRILRNPHKGWYLHYIDNGITRTFYRDTIKEGDDLLDFPYLNHMYLRFDWGDIEKEQGVYDWSYIDEIFEKWGKLGYRFSLRVCTYEGLEDDIRYPTPKWVFDKGAKFFDHNGIIEPHFDDPVYLEYLDIFLAECGRKFDGHPLVEFVDIGTFGTWGEGHTGQGSGKAYPQSAHMRHVEMTLKHFQKTYVMINDDITRQALHGFPETDPQKMIDFCLEHGCGARDDSPVYTWGYNNGPYHTVLQPTMFDQFWEKAPIDMEIVHLKMTPEENYRSGYTIAACLDRVHATYAGFHADPRKWLDKYYDLTVYAGARMGYWYFPEGILLPESVSGIASYADVAITNRGYGLGYFDGELEFKLKSEGGELISLGRTPANNRSWMPGETSHVRAKLDFKNIPEGNYQLSMGLYEGDRAIQFAASESKTEDDCIIVGNINVRN